MDGSGYFYSNSFLAKKNKGIRNKCGINQSNLILCQLFLFSKKAKRQLKNNKFELSKQYFQIAHDIALRIDNEILLSNAVNMLGYSLRQLGKLKESLSWYSKGLELREKT